MAAQVSDNTAGKRSVGRDGGRDVSRYFFFFFYKRGVRREIQVCNDCKVVEIL